MINIQRFLQNWVHIIEIYQYPNTHWLVHLYILCISEDKVWTTIVNDLPAQSSVSSSSKTVLTLNYSMSAEQVTLKSVWI